MKCNKKMMQLYAITDRAWLGKQTLYEQVEAALKGGATCIQLREKKLDKNEFLEEAIEISKLCKSFKVPLIINDDVDIAIKSGADGVHVGQDDMTVSEVRSLVGENLIVGVSAHSVNEALEAVKGGADYLGAGAVFATSTKKDANLLPREILKDICSAVEIPVVAIGGITRDNLSELSGSGVSGVALVSAVFAAEDIEKECKYLRKLSEEMTCA